MTPIQILFSFKGRIDPSKFLLYTFGLLILTSLTRNLFVTPINIDNLIPAITNYAYAITISWILLSLHIKRWHDRNKSGLWILFHILLIRSTYWSTTRIVNLTGSNLQASIFLPQVVLVVSVLALIWFFVELVLMPGTPGPNKYGPDPTQPTPTAE
ncbi:MAG: DUF805 domain-containing protein [Chloroflexota bacterium]